MASSSNGGPQRARGRWLRALQRGDSTLTLQDLTRVEIEELGEALKKNTTSKTLSLRWTWCQDEAASAAAVLAETLTVNTTLSALSLSGNHIKPAAASALAEALMANTTLEVLELHSNHLQCGAPCELGGDAESQHRLAGA